MTRENKREWFPNRIFIPDTKIMWPPIHPDASDPLNYRTNLQNIAKKILEKSIMVGYY